MENYKPKKGDYLLYFYHGVIGGINSVVKIVDVNRGEIKVTDVHSEVGINVHHPISFSIDAIEPKPTKFCYTPISEDEVKSLIDNIDLDDIICEISVYRKEPFNQIKDWRLKTILDDYNSIKRYTRDLHKHESFRLYRVWKDDKIIYDPMTGYTK